MDEEHLPRLDVGDEEDVGPDGARHLGQPCGVDERHAAGHRQHLLGRRHDALGVAPAVDEGAHLVAHLPALDALTERRDASAHLEARVVRRAGWRRVVAHPLHDVGAVDARGDDVDEHLAGPHLGVGHLVEDEAVGVSGLRDRDGAHGSEPIDLRPSRERRPRPATTGPG